MLPCSILRSLTWTVAKLSVFAVFSWIGIVFAYTFCLEAGHILLSGLEEDPLSFPRRMY